MLYDVVQVLIRVILRVFYRVEVEGRENIPDGGCLIVSNHLSWADTVFVMYAFPRRPAIHTMANEATVFNTRFKRWLMPKLAVFPIRRNRGLLDEEAVNLVYELLERGERVLIFPEGAYGRDGQLKPLKDGIGYFAINSGKPILPVSLAGSAKLRPWSRIRVVIGKPFIPDPPRMWELKRRVTSVVSGVQLALGRLGRRSARPRAGRLRRMRIAGRRWLRREPRMDRPLAEGAESAEVEGGQPEVDNGQPAQQQEQAQQPAP
jgi:1-acyl-sn-glycerol-3-phosphate acyltransferase